MCLNLFIGLKFPTTYGFSLHCSQSLAVKLFYPYSSGFLQVKENWRKVREFVWSGKNIIFEKSVKMILDHADCRFHLCLQILKSRQICGFH